MRIMWFSLFLYHYVLCCSSQDLLGDFFVKTIFPIYKFQDGWGQSRRPKLVYLFPFNAFYWKGGIKLPRVFIYEYRRIH